MMNKQTIDEMVIGKAQLARVGMRKLSNLSSETRNNALETMAEASWEQREQILTANQIDLEKGERTD